MDARRWQQITESFDNALEYPPAERHSFLVRICAGDNDLLSEVMQLLAEFEKAGQFLENPILASAHMLSAGDLIGGRYRIQDLIGRGGMGEVYRAHDELMDERIAMKTLHPEFCDNRELRHRFQREVRLARKVTHPNVCRVFDVGVDCIRGLPLHFFTMQLLEGPTLAARIREHGPFARTEALPLIAQMSEGLAAAHQAGIIHRDFKSSNIILCDGEAVITDFGLARFAPGEVGQHPATLTLNAQIAGTVAFMSPEQLSGAEVTPASDIYSFGVVLFEMATGKLPFDDRHIINSAMQRASEATLNVRAVAPEVDLQWATVIARCLQRDPARRFRSAADIPAELQPGVHWHLTHLHWSRRRWLAASGLAVVSGAALSAIPAVSRYFLQSAKLPEGAEAVLSPITNSTGDARFNGITELFRSQLSQSVHLSLIDPGRLLGEFRQMRRPEDTNDPAALREAAWRLNSALTIFGDVSRIGPDYALNIQLETRGSQPDNPRAKKIRSFTAPDADALMHTIRDAALWVRETAGETGENIANFDRIPANATTPSWEALSNYARGQAYFMKQDFEPAILEFEAALRIDPGFTLAAVRRADLLVSQHRQTEGFRQWRAAIAMLNKRPVTRPEELNARGMFALDTGDMETADRYFRTWSVEYPHDWRGPFYRMIPLCMNGHTAEALELLKQIAVSMPDYGDTYAQMIACYLILGRTDEARALVPAVRRLNRPERADLREAYIRFREADCVGCLEILRRVQRSSYRRGAADAMLQEALLLIDCGYPQAAAVKVEAFLQSNSWVETSGQQIDLRVAQAWAEMLCGRTQAAVDHARSALAVETGPLVVALCGTVFARCGPENLARQALENCADMQDFPLYRMARSRILGELASSAGRTDAALVEFRKAAAIEPPIAHRQYLIEALPAGSPERLELSVSAVRHPWQNLRPPLMYHIGAMAIAVPDVNRSQGHSNDFSRKFAESSRMLEKAI